MKTCFKKINIFLKLPLLFSIFLSSACATLSPEIPKTLTSTERGTVLFLDKYEFKAPPEGWKFLKNLEGGDFEIGFLKFEKGDFPSQTTFMYDEQPYGSSQDLNKRFGQYYIRFLFNSGIDLRVMKKESLFINGMEAIGIRFEGENPNRNEKVKSKVYLLKKGNRIISFVCTQWRSLNGAFSEELFDHFEAFVQSFKFLKKDFYEELEDEIRELEKIDSV